MRARSSRGFTLIELMIVIAIIAIIAAIAIPGILSATRAANERNASASLKQISSVEMTFKTTDADGNKTQDYWIDDVAAFYQLAPGGTATREGIKLIEVSVAAADGDADTTNYTASTATPISSWSSKAGYWYMALPNMETDSAGTEAAYSASSVGGDGKGHNSDRYGFAAAPATYGSSGKHMFIINENGTMFKKDLASQSAIWQTAPTAGSSATNGKLAAGVDDFPFDPMKQGWSKLD